MSFRPPYRTLAFAAAPLSSSRRQAGRGPSCGIIRDPVVFDGNAPAHPLPHFREQMFGSGARLSPADPQLTLQLRAHALALIELPP